MRIVSINEAEAVLEPFWDGGTSDFEDTDPRFCVLDAYKITCAPDARASVTQAWAWAEFRIEIPTEDAPSFTMRRACDETLDGYDTFLLSGSIPKNAALRVLAVLDGVEREIIPRTSGIGETAEYTGHFIGKKLTALCLELYSEAKGCACAGNIAWMGVQNSTRLAHMLAQKSPYNAQWDGFFKEKRDTDIVPEIGILFDASELPALREKLKLEPFCTVLAEKRAAAQRDLQIVPEEYIGRYVPTYDKRWCRARDKNRGNIASIMENLAFVGLLDGDSALLKMACRHLISLCHCTYWCESMMGVFPGATWHHRSFTESAFAKAAALVLDWAGSLLTPHAKQLVRDTLAMKALPRLESDFRRIEYIRHMNQGIVFTNGRVYAYLALLPRHPRYESCLAEAERDLVEMIGNYVQPDGGTLEGPGYWMFTFRDIMSVVYALARKKQVPFTHYKDLFLQTGTFALGMMSMEDDGTEVLSVNDAHPASHMSCALASSFYAFTGDARWQALYTALLAKNRIDEDVFALISVPPTQGGGAAVQPCGAALFPQTGQMGSIRQGADLRTHLHYCTGPAYRGHYHQDKGSLILEADGIALCPDFGTGFYHEADLFGLTDPIAHSLLLPIYADGRMAHQHPNAPCGTVVCAEADETALAFCTDETKAWSGAPYALQQRRVISPFAELVLLEDRYILDEADSVTFLLNGAAPFTLDGTNARLCREGITLRVQPLNWQWKTVACVQMQDGEHRAVYQLQAQAGTARGGTLLTALYLEKELAVHCETSEIGFVFTHGTMRYEVQVPDGAL